VSEGQYALQLLGPFRLVAPNGHRTDVSSKKGQALIAMLATAGGGERTRSWLQTQLWGSRGQDQAQASLRSELSSLRNLINVEGSPLLQSDHSRVWIDLNLIRVDVRDEAADVFGTLLEGLDIPGEEGFEDWLREERGRLTARRAVPVAPKPTPELVASPSGPIVFAGLPALAVLPFANLTGDADLDFLAEGVAEDLIDRLSRMRWLPIIARSSSFAVRDANPDPKQVGAMLGARYLLEGRIRLVSSEPVLQASLVDSETGNVAWSNKLALADHAAPHALEELLTGLTTALGAKIDLEEQSRALRKPQSDLNVRELIWRGRWHLNRFSREDSALAKSYFAQALAQEPNAPEAIIQNTWANLWDLWAQRGSDEEIRAVRQMAQKAIIADYDDARGHMLAGIAECWLRQPIRAEALLRRALDLNPSLVLAYGQLGSVLYLKDEPEAAIEALNTAIRLSPNDHSIFYILGELAMSHLMLGNYAQAVEHADNAIMNRSAYWYGHVIKINALARSGSIDRARAARDDLQMSNAQFQEKFVDWLPFIDSKWHTYLKEGLNLSRG
jgi:TolB-like protein/cytochrome c-type biogenesis protein CcmH/NrfG